MTDEASLESQVTYLYNASAKGLYNLALYSIGDQRLAEQLAIDAFASAYNRLSDKTDVTRFRIKSTRQLYRIIKKTLINHSKYSSHEQDTHEDAKFISNKGAKPFIFVVNRIVLQRKISAVALFTTTILCRASRTNFVCPTVHNQKTFLSND